MRKIGKVGKINQTAIRKNKEQFLIGDITSCENCGSVYNLQFAHRHKRVWYRGKPELLHDFRQVLLLCQVCHDGIEYSRQKTEELFTRLRGANPLGE